MKRLSLLAAVAVALTALVVGTLDDGGPRTSEDRARDLAAEIRCPTCESQSSLESDAPTAEGVRTEIARRIRTGETDAQIRDFFVSRYGEEILLDPPSSGLAGLVWVLPALALVLGAIGLVTGFRRWRGRGPGAPSDEDRVLVERARRSAVGAG